MHGKQFTLSEEFNLPMPQGYVERRSYESGYRCVAGLDEVGRGPLAGPVVAAAVVLPRGFSHPEVKDSKLLTAEQRNRLSMMLRECALSWGVGVVEVDDIDRMNILQASLLAMAKAFRALRPLPDCLLIDGHQAIPAEFFQLRFSAQLPHQRPIVKGDRLCVSIAAASIIAKVARDTIMAEFDKSFPEYGFASHKGYSCDSHIDALRRLGPSPIHRRSFRPVRDLFHGDVEAVPAPLFAKP